MKNVNELRDYFAASVMQSLVASEGYANENWPRNIAEDAYKIADAMLAAKAKPSQAEVRSNE